MRSVKTDRLLKLLLCVLLGGLVYAIYAGIHERVVVDGDTSPDFTITADNGRLVSMPHFAGKLLVLNFWASWCGPCVEETPSLSRFAQQYADKGVVVLGISVDQSEKAYRTFLQKYKPAFLTVRERKLHEAFGTYMWPETYIISADGKVLKKIAQGVDWSEPSTTQFFNSLLATQ
jgi:cytochrome c biogenesis protein CcmG, thiol:disulfide interchange protein DsbE